MRLPGIADTTGWTARQKRKLTLIDVAICAAFPATLVGFVLLAACIHSAEGVWAYFVFAGCIIFAVLAVTLPVWVVLWVAFNHGQTAESMLWFESILAGVWTAFIVAMLIGDRVESAFAAAVSILAAIPVVFVTGLSRNRRRRLARQAQDKAQPSPA